MTITNEKMEAIAKAYAEEMQAAEDEVCSSLAARFEVDTEEVWDAVETVRARDPFDS